MKNVRCPICDRAMESASKADGAHHPFCSERCQLIDLGRWLSGRYRLEDPVPSDEADTLEAELDPP